MSEANLVGMTMRLLEKEGFFRGGEGEPVLVVVWGYGEGVG